MSMDRGLVSAAARPTSSILGLGPITSAYGDTAGRAVPHNGVDIGVRSGTAIPIPVGGTVERITYDRIGGLQLIVKSAAGGLEQVFAHLSAVPDLATGDAVRTGQVVAYSGATGDVTGPHLHYEIRRPQGGTMNPVDFLSEFVAGFTSPDGAGAASAPSSAASVPSSTVSAPAQAASDPCPGGGELTQVGPVTFCRYTLPGGFFFLTPANTGDAPAPVKGIATAVDTLTSRATWAKIGFSIVGGALILFGIGMYTGGLRASTMAEMRAGK